MAKDDPRELETAHRWLTSAAAELGVDDEIIRGLAKPLLDLTREVAHNRSRSAAPLTAFLVGLSVDKHGTSDEVVADVEKRIDALVDRIHATDQHTEQEDKKE